jgi:hypothetical protein
MCDLFQNNMKICNILQKKTLRVGITQVLVYIAPNITDVSLWLEHCHDVCTH